MHHLGPMSRLGLEQIKSVNLFVIVFNSLHFHLSALKRSVLKYAGRNNFEESIWASAWYFTLGKLKIPPKLSLIFFLLFPISLWWLCQQLFFLTRCICSRWMVTLFKDRAWFIYSYYSRKKLKTGWFAELELDRMDYLTITWKWYLRSIAKVLTLIWIIFNVGVDSHQLLSNFL